VWLLDGPIITGPNTSNNLMVSLPLAWVFYL
jgi:hypothetical protein